MKLVHVDFLSTLHKLFHISIIAMLLCFYRELKNAKFLFWCQPIKCACQPPSKNARFLQLGMKNANLATLVATALHIHFFCHALKYLFHHNETSSHPFCFNFAYNVSHFYHCYVTIFLSWTKKCQILVLMPTDKKCVPTAFKKCQILAIWHEKCQLGNPAAALRSSA